MDSNNIANWPMVALALIAAAPGILAAITAYKTKKLQEENNIAVAEVHTLVNARFTSIENKLKAALEEIGRITGQPTKSIEDAPPK